MRSPLAAWLRPRIAGLVTGIIEAPPGTLPEVGAQHAKLDEQGRYLVRFLFDTTPPGERPARRRSWARKRSGR